ncbi:MAG: 6-carboxytetrahydropterin synthase [gamma proteobacterium symbiont of Taylorina sp.]|nr:6-carboxytetrahydropterin synthase [gamma proteobacterium symbiont of Taylorina sp.]
MTDKIYYIASASFEAACQINILPEIHPAAQLHGHSYNASVRIPFATLDDELSFIRERKEAVNFLKDHLQSTVKPLNYTFLNQKIPVPTDENLARWIHREISSSEISRSAIDRVAIQSTDDSGVDLDNNNQAHIWRRYRFEAAHQLPNVPAGHPCGRMHGHGFEVILHANQDLKQAYDEEDMGIDFVHIDEYWEKLHEQLDYNCLNDINGLENPTSEVLAHWIWQQLKTDFTQLSWVTVYETHTSGCHYNGDHYRIWKEQRFESALKLSQVGENDKRRRLHGHSYLIRLHLTAELDEVMGWTVDYGDVKSLFSPIYDQLDHHRLDLLEGMEEANVTHLLYWIKDKMADVLPQLDRIDLFETPGCGAILCWGEEGPALPD